MLDFIIIALLAWFVISVLAQIHEPHSFTKLTPRQQFFKTALRFYRNGRKF